jgi:hypothetical protein
MTPDVNVLVASFLRLITSPKIFQSANRIKDAVAFLISDSTWKSRNLPDASVFAAVHAAITTRC